MKKLVLTATLDDEKVWIQVTNLTWFVQTAGIAMVSVEDSNQRQFTCQKRDLTDLEVEQCW